MMSKTSHGALLAPLLAFAALVAAEPAAKSPFVVVLGIAQDAGYPQAGTKKSPAWDDPSLARYAASLALVDPRRGERWLFEATPDFKPQLHRLDEIVTRGMRLPEGGEAYRQA